MTNASNARRLAARLLLAAAPAALLAGMAAPAIAQTAVSGGSTNAGTVSGGAVPLGGTGPVFSGATANTGGADTSTITLGASKTILNWNGFNLASGDTLNFVFGSNTDIVLNRVNSGAGTISGALRGFVGSTAGAAGGNVWFLANGGILVNSTAAINVGGLLLSTGQITDAGFFNGNYNFSSAANSITVASGANLTASNGALTLMAPSISFGGNATASGSAALVGAVDAQIVFDADMDAYLGITINEGSSQTVAVDVGQSASFDAASVASGGKTYLIAAGNGTGLGSVLLGGFSADRVEFVEGDVVLYAAGSVPNGGPARSVVSGGVLQGLESASGGGDVTIGAANVSAGNFDVRGIDDVTVNDAVTVSGNARFEAGDLLTIGTSVTTGGDYTIRADDWTGGAAFSPNEGGDINIEDTAFGLTIGNVAATDDLRITTENGSLTIAGGAVTASGGSVSLAATGFGSSLTLNSNVVDTGADDSVTLTSSGSIAQAAGAAITTGTLTGSSTGATALNTATNQIGTLAAFTADGLSIADTGGLATSGTISSGTGNLTLTTTGTLSVSAAAVRSSGTGATSLTGTTIQLNAADIDGGAGGVSFSGATSTTGVTRIDAAGDISFANALTVAGNPFVTSGGNVTFNSTINGSGFLVVNAPGVTSFGGAVGGTTALAGIETDAAGSTTLSGNLTSSGAISLNDAVNLGAATQLTSTGGGAIAFGGTVDGAYALTVNTSGATTFAGDVGFSTALASLTTNTGGTTLIGGGVVTSGNQAFGDAATLAGDLASTAGSLTFGNTLTLAAGAHGIAGADVTFNGAVNAAAAGDLTSLTVTANGGGGTDNVTFNSTLGATAALDALTVNGPTVVAGGGYTTGVSQSWNGAVTLTGGGTKAFNGGAGAVSFNGTLDGDSTVNVTADGGVTFGGAIGIASRLTALSTSGGVTNLNGGEIRTTGGQSYSGSVSLGANAVLDAQTAGLIFNAAVGGGFGLELRTTADSFLNGAVNVASLTTDAGGTTNINNAAGVTTTGNQAYNDAVLLGANVTLTGAGSSFTTVAGNTVSRDLTLNFSGASNIVGGNLSSIRNLAVGGGGTTTVSGAISTSGTQTYADAVMLTGDAALTSVGAGANGNITLNGITGNGFNLDIDSSVGSSLASPTTVTSNGGASGVNLLDVDGGIIDSNAALSASTISLTALHGGIDVGADITASGSVTLDAAGAITGTGRIGGSAVALTGAAGVGTALNALNTAATTLTARSSGGGVFISEQNGVTLQDAGALSNAAATIYSVRADGAISVNGVLSGGSGGVDLESVNGSLVIDASGGISSAGPIDLDAGGVLQVGGLVQGGVLGVDLQSAGQLSVTGVGLVTATGGTLRLSSSGGAVAIGGLGVQNGAGTLDLDSFGGVIQTTAIAAGTLTGTNTGQVTLLNAGNDIGSLGAFRASGLALRDTANLNVTGAVDIGTGVLELISGGSIDQAAGSVITAGTFTGSANGAVDLFDGLNQIQNLGSFTNSGTTFSLRNGRELNVAGLLTNTGGDVSLAAIGGLAVNNGINALGRNVTAGVTSGDLIMGAAGSVIGAEVVLSTDQAFLNASGSDAITASGRWLVYSAAPSGNAYDGLDSGSTAIWNGSLATRAPGTLTGNRYVFAYQPTLTVTTTGASKVYGTDLGGSAGSFFTVSGYHPGVAGAFLGDTAATAVSGAPVISSDGFAERATVAGGAYAVTASLGTLASASGYAFTIDNAGQIVVTPKILTGTATANDKTYDGNTAASGSIALSGLLDGDDVGAAGTFAFVDKNAGVNKTVTVSGVALTGADAGNYMLTLPASALADILLKALTGSVSVSNKTYDGTTAASGTVTLAGMVAGDTVDGSASFAFADKNAGTGKTVSVSGATLSGADAGNYTLTLPASALADILQKALTGSVSVSNKTYDGTTAASGTVTLVGVVAGNAVDGSASFAFADKNAGTGKTVTVSGATLSGADAGNYTLTLPASALADILQKALTGSVSVSNKTYDGTTAAVGAIALDGIVSGDSVGASGTFAFADKNAGVGKTVGISGVSLGGADAGNYSLSIPASALADILQKTITATVVAQDKVYDGTTAASGSIALAGVVAGDQLSAGASFAFADPNAGAGKAVSVTNAALSGADAGNYTWIVPASTVAAILQRAITVTADPQVKVEGSSDPALTYAVTSGSLVAGDALSGALARAPGEAPGGYAIEQGSLAASANYRLTFIGGNLVIEAAAAPIPNADIRDDRAGFLAYLASLHPGAQSRSVTVVDERDCSGPSEQAACDAAAPAK